MKKFIIKKISDNSVIEILAMNIDAEHNILTREGDTISLLSIDEFKDMVLGPNGGSPTYVIVD